MASAARFDLNMHADEKALVAKAAAFSERNFSTFARALNSAFNPNPSLAEAHGAHARFSARIQQMTRRLRTLQLQRAPRFDPCGARPVQGGELQNKARCEPTLR